MTTPDRRTHRDIDMASLKGLAHPLRVQLLEALSTFGPSTASGLADRLGESSGATSYHLRQLEKHGFVQEDASRGSGRERWWQRTPSGLNLNVTDFPVDSAERAAAETLEREWDRSRAAILDEFTRRGPRVLSKDWYDASTIATTNMTLTVDQLAALRDEVEGVVEGWFARHRDQQDPAARRVQVQFNAFPVIDGDSPSNDGGTA